jgi:hypothetical protein
MVLHDFQTRHDADRRGLTLDFVKYAVWNYSSDPRLIGGLPLHLLFVARRSSLEAQNRNCLADIVVAINSGHDSMSRNNNRTPSAISRPGKYASWAVRRKHANALRAGMHAVKQHSDRPCRTPPQNSSIRRIERTAVECFSNRRPFLDHQDVARVS